MLPVTCDLSGVTKKLGMLVIIEVVHEIVICIATSEVSAAVTLIHSYTDSLRVLSYAWHKVMVCAMCNSYTVVIFHAEHPHCANYKCACTHLGVLVL